MPGKEPLSVQRSPLGSPASSLPGSDESSVLPVLLVLLLMLPESLAVDWDRWLPAF